MLDLAGLRELLLLCPIANDFSLPFARLQFVIASNVAFCFGTVFAKSSVLLLYLRLFSVRRALRYVIVVGMAAVVLVNVLFIALILRVYTRLPSDSVMVAVKRNVRFTCPAYITHGAFNAAIDVGLVVIPVCMVWNLQMPRMKKYATGAAFATGAL